MNTHAACRGGSLNVSLRWIAAGGLFALASVVHAEAIVGKVIEVPDGETVVVEQQGKAHTVHLAAIDAPEPGQAHAARSTEALRKHVLGRQVRAWCPPSAQQPGRRTCFVFLDRVDVGRAQVRFGHAWWLGSEVTGQWPAAGWSYEIAHGVARDERRGLWAGASPVAPWVWRGGRR